MEALIITRKDLDENNFFKEEGIQTDKSIIIEEGLGYVRFKKSVKTKYCLIIKAGSGIEAGWGIEAGEGIKAGWGIVSFLGGIVAKWVDCLRVAVGFNIEREETIEAKIRRGTVVLGKVIQKKKKVK